MTTFITLKDVERDVLADSKIWTKSNKNCKFYRRKLSATSTWQLKWTQRALRLTNLHKFMIFCKISRILLLFIGTAVGLISKNIHTWITIVRCLLVNLSLFNRIMGVFNRFSLNCSVNTARTDNRFPVPRLWLCRC